MRVTLVTNIPNQTVMGIENARQYAEMLVKQAVAKLDLFGAKADLLREAAEFSLQRRN